MMLEKGNVSAKLTLYIINYYKDLTIRKREKRKLIEQLGDI